MRGQDNKKVTLRKAVLGTARRLDDSVSRTGLAHTSVDAGEVRKPFTGDAFRLQRRRYLRKLRVPDDEVFAAFSRAWQDSGYRVRDGDSAARELIAEDDAGYELTIRRSAADQLLFTATSPPVGDSYAAPSPHRSALYWAIGCACGAAPQILLMVLILVEVSGSRPGADNELVVLLAIPDFVVLPVWGGLGLVLMFASPRSRPFGAGLLTGTAVATLIMAGVCLTASSSGDPGLATTTAAETSVGAPWPADGVGPRDF